MKIRQDDTHDTIYFSDMVWFVLSKWRSVLAVAVVLGLLLGAFSFMKSSKTAKYQQHLASIDIQGELKNADDDVRDIASRQKQFDELKNYIDDGLLMNMDSMSVEKTVMTYYVDGSLDQNLSEDAKDMRTGALTQAYMGKSVGEKVRTRVVNSFGGKITENDLDYLLTGKTNDNTFLVTIKGPDSDTCDKIAECVKDVIDDSRDELTDNIGSHIIELVDESHTIGIDSAVSDAQTAVNKSYSSLKDKINSDRASVDSAGKELLDAIEFQGTEKTPASANISKKYVAAGILLGMIIMAVIYIIKYAYTGKIVSSDQIYHTSKAPVFGELTVGYAKLGTGLDRKIYKKLYGISRSTDVDKQAEYISAGIINICHAKDIKSVYLINNASDDEETNKLIERILKPVSDDGIKTSYGYDDGCSAEVVRAVAEADAEIIFAGLFKTDFASFGNKVSVCRQQNRQIIGSIVEM